MSKVELFVYEVTKGLAAQLSTTLLGRHIPGVWHTGIVCFGMEYFFGSGGIQNISPGTTVVGAPDKIINLGETQITDDLFHEFLFTIGENRYRPEKYHLFDHNCNTFSNEVAQFLTGKSIPSYILDLPSDVANTPIGAMLKTFMDGVGSPVGGRTDPPSQYVARHQSSPHRCSGQRSAEMRPDKRDTSVELEPVVFSYEVDECCKKLRELFETDRVKLEIIEALIKNGEKDEQKTSETFEALYSLLRLVEESSASDQLALFADALSMIALQKQPNVFSSKEGADLLERLLKLFESPAADSNTLQSLLKLATNLYSDSKRRETLIKGHKQFDISVNKRLIAHCLESLVGDNRHKENEIVAVSLAHNISLSEMEEDTALELSSALLHWISTADKNSSAGKRCIATLRQLAKWNHQVKELAEMTLDVKLFE